MIKVEGLSKYYGDSRAIENISFDIKHGEIVGLLGLNGAGKSTILKILGCYLAPSRGSASIGGFSVSTEAQNVRELIGFLPDTSPLYDEMTARAYLNFVARLKGVESRHVKDAVDEALEKTNLTNVQDAHLGTLSHGFRQRVGIAQALVHKPKVLILDEPINGLDPIQIVEMRDLIKSLKGDHTVILSSHILSEITKTCDRILIIDSGELKAQGTELSIEGKIKHNVRVELQVKGSSESIVSKLRAIPGVVACEQKESVEDAMRFVCEAEDDLRGAMAKAVVNSGADLVGLSKLDDGLESLFMKLVKNSKN
ncbi:MAG: ABC transporter ATP-binding protein [Oligoflexales bacterium]